MSFPFLQPPPPPPPPPPPQQQTITVYPNPVVTTHPPYTQSSSSHHSAGSFGTVLLILAIVVVVSAIACFLGRLCNRSRRHNNHPASHKQRPTDFDNRHGGNDDESGFRRRDRALNKPGDGQGNESRGEISSAPKAYDMDSGNLHGGIRRSGDDVEPGGPPA